MPSLSDSTNEKSSAVDFELLFNSATDLYLVLDENLIIVAASNAYLNTTMVKREKILGTYLFDAFPDNPDNPAKNSINVRESMERVLKNKVGDTIAAIQYDIRSSATGKFEKHSWNALNCHIIIEGKVKYILHRVENITENIKAKQRLRESEESLRLMIEATTDYAILTLDIEGKIKTWNAGAERIKGYRAKEIIGRHFSVFYPSEVRNAKHPDAELQEAKKHGRYAEEGWRVRKDGSLFWASVIITPLYDDKHNLIGYGKITRDLSDIKKAEEDLKKSEAQLIENTERYELAVAGSNTGLWDWEIATNHVYYSSNLKSLLGYNDTEFPPLFSSMENCLHPKDHDRVLAEINRHLKEHIPYDIEYRLRHKTGEYYWFLGTGQAKWDKDGKPVRMAGSLIDITDRKQQAAARRLSTPVLQFGDHLLILPIIGNIGTLRAKQITKQLLMKVQEIRAKAVIVDITGVPMVDLRVAAHLLQTVDATG